MRRFLLLLSLISSSFIQVSAQNYLDLVTIDNLEYEVYANGATLTRALDRECTDVIIADSVTIDNIKYPVTKIGTTAFLLCTKMTTVKIPNSVTYIGSQAFEECFSLKEIDLPDSLREIRQNAFKSCTSLERLVLPEKVAVVRSDIVKYCSSLVSIDILSEVEMTLSENAFRTCPEGVVTLPLKSKLQSINVLSDNPTLSSIDGVLYSKDMKRLIRCPELKEGEVIIPEGVERIEPYAFFNCVYLKAVQMPETLKEFGDCPTITFITNETRNGVMMNCQSLEELVFPQGLTWISNRALANCFSLKKVTLPDSLKLIGREAFYEDSCIVEMTLPEGVDSIAEFAFWNCRKWELSLPKRLRSLGGMAFYSCVTPDSLVIGERLKDIGYRAFVFNSATVEKLKKVYVCQEEPILFDVELGRDDIFGKETFKIGRKTEERFPQVLADSCTLYVPTGSREKYKALSPWVNFKHIEEFDYQSSGEEEPADTTEVKNEFTALTEEGVEMIFTVISEEEKTCKVCRIPELTEGHVTIPDEANGYQVVEVGTGAFLNQRSVTGVSIPETVTAIRSSAFAWCTELKEIHIPQSVSVIEGVTFHQCSNLTSVTLPDDMTEIPMSMFSGCKLLRSIDIPKDVTTIGQWAFESCSSLEGVEFPEGLDSISNQAFSDCIALKSLTMPARLRKIAYRVFDNCSGLTSIIVEEGNTVYDSRGNCNALIETATNTLLYGCINTVIPDGITTIGSKAFVNCWELDSISIPESVESIGEYAFSGCTGLVSIELPESVTSIGKGAFSSDTGLVSINIPRGITSIKTETFYGCSSIITVEIPEGVSSIGDLAFYGCSSLESVISEIYEPFQISSTTFPDNTNSNVLRLYVPIGTKGKYEATPGWSVFTEILEPEPGNINSLNIKKQTFPVCDLQGRRYSSPLTKGIYIQNGKKYIIK